MLAERATVGKKLRRGIAMSIFTDVQRDFFTESVNFVLVSFLFVPSCFLLFFLGCWFIECGGAKSRCLKYTL